LNIPRYAFYLEQEAIDRLSSVAPQIKTELIPDAGHDLTIVQAAFGIKKLSSFLKVRKIRSNEEPRFLKLARE
jgi:hypothetical protein